MAQEQVIHTKHDNTYIPQVYSDKEWTNYYEEFVLEKISKSRSNYKWMRLFVPKNKSEKIKNECWSSKSKTLHEVGRWSNQVNLNTSKSLILNKFSIYFLRKIKNSNEHFPFKELQRDSRDL